MVRNSTKKEITNEKFQIFSPKFDFLHKLSKDQTIYIRNIGLN